MSKPVIAVTFGDAAGIGPELVAKLVSDPKAREAATIVLVGDPWVWEQGQKIAGVTTVVQPIANFAEARGKDGVLFLSADTVAPADITPGAVTPEAGRGARAALTAC